MLAPAQTVGNPAVQAGGSFDENIIEAARMRETAKAVVSAQESGAATISQETEAAYAVQPTPVTAKAVKVDLDNGQGSKDGVVQYPITGPDKFARTIAEAKQQAFIDEQREIAEQALDNAAKGRDEAGSRAEMEVVGKVSDGRKADAEERMERGPAVTNAADNAIEETNEAMEAEMEAKVADQVMDTVAEAKREE